MNYEELSDRELDALVAEKVMGITACEGDVIDYDGYQSCLSCGFECDDWNVDHYFVPLRYSTRIEDAWQVVERLREQGFNWSFEGKGSWFVNLTKPIDIFRSLEFSFYNSKSFPKTICITALKACERVK